MPPPLDTPSPDTPVPAQPPGSSVRVPHGVDVDALAAALRRAVSGEVRFDAGSLAVYAHDASNYRQVPIGVVLL